MKLFSHITIILKLSIDLFIFFNIIIYTCYIIIVQYNNILNYTLLCVYSIHTDQRLEQIKRIIMYYVYH